MTRQRTKTFPKMVKLDGDLNRRLADFRFERRIASEAETVRVLMRAGLEALKEKGVAVG